MIEIKYDKNVFSIHYDANLYEMIAYFVALLDAIDSESDTKFTFEMANRYRKDRDAKNNSDN